MTTSDHAQSGTLNPPTSPWAMGWRRDLLWTLTATGEALDGWTTSDLDRALHTWETVMVLHRDSKWHVLLHQRSMNSVSKAKIYGFICH